MRLSATHVRHCLGFAHVGLREALNLQIEPPQNQEFIHLHLSRCILRLRRRIVRLALQLRLVRTYVSLLGNSALETIFELQRNSPSNVRRKKRFCAVVLQKDDHIQFIQLKIDSTHLATAIAATRFGPVRLGLFASTLARRCTGTTTSNRGRRCTAAAVITSTRSSISGHFGKRRGIVPIQHGNCSTGRHNGSWRGASTGIATAMRIAMPAIRALVVHHHGCLVAPFWTTANGLAEVRIGTRTRTRTATITTHFITGRGRTPVATMRMVRRIAMRRRRTVAVGSMMARRRPAVMTPVSSPRPISGISRWWATVICGMIPVRRWLDTFAAILLLAARMLAAFVVLSAVAPVTSAGLGTLLPRRRRRRPRLSVFTRHARRRRTVRVPKRRRSAAGPGPGAAAASTAKNVLRRRTPVVRRGRIVMSVRRRRPVAVSRRRRISAVGRHVMRGRTVAIARRRRPTGCVTMRRCASRSLLIGVGFGLGRLLPLAPALLAARRRRFRPRCWHGGVCRAGFVCAVLITKQPLPPALMDLYLSTSINAFSVAENAIRTSSRQVRQGTDRNVFHRQ